MNKHWSKTRQMLEEDFLCDSLKGRVKYFTTRYNSAHDHTGRVCILVDKVEKLNMPFENSFKAHREVDKRKDGTKSLKILYDEVWDELHQTGTFEPWDFGVAIDEYFENSIEKSLHSENILVRLFAILDRRVGKRTLENLKNDINDIPEWLKFFYNLRFESEGII